MDDGPPRGREQRQSPRIDVFLRVDGELVDLNTHVLVHNLSRTGFAVVSNIAFQAGQTLDFKITGPGTPPFTVTAEAVHSSPMRNPAGLHLAGFKFVPGRLIATVPTVLIDRLIEAIGAEDARRAMFGESVA